MTNSANALGNTIKACRNAKKMTLAELAEKVGISGNHLQRLESGKNMPSVPLLYELAQALNFSIDDAFFGMHREQSETRTALLRRIAKFDEPELEILLATANAVFENSWRKNREKL